jgi:hypothetical protein
VAVRRVPCCCCACVLQMHQPWVPGQPAENQKRFKTSTDCEFHNMFTVQDDVETYNDWKIINLIPKRNSDPEVESEVARVYLDALGESAQKKIEVGHTGAFGTDDPHYPGYYLVQWTAGPHQLVEPQELENEDVAQAGEHVCQAKFLELLPGSKRWWHTTNISVTVRLQQVLETNLDLQEISEENKPHPGIRSQAVLRNAKQIVDDVHATLHDEILRREIANVQEDCEIDELSSSCDSSNSGSGCESELELESGAE